VSYGEVKVLKQPGEGVDRDAGLAFCLDGGTAISKAEQMDDNIGRAEVPRM
jgi:hypothetical protein